MATIAVTVTTATAMAATVTKKGLLAAFGSALMLAACSHAAAPPSAQKSVSPKNAARAKQEVKTGVRAYGHHSYKIALAHFDSALKIDPPSLEARYDRGLTEEKLFAYGRAATDLAAVLNVHPNWTGARLHLAAAQYHGHQFADAARNFDIALRSNSKAWKLWLDDGVSNFQLHRYAEARKRFARALALSPKSGRAHYWLGMTYRRLGDRPKARNELALAAHSRDVVVRTAARRQLKQK